MLAPHHPRDPGRLAAAGAAFAVALGAAYALKRFYSGASAADLRFVLAPTTWLVEALGGHRFEWTPGGYLSRDLRFVIAPACAGVNFLIVAFCALVLAFVRPARPGWQNAALLPVGAAAAYAATLLANALRILLAIPLWAHRVAFGPLTGARLHELLGVAVFLGGLLLLVAVARRVAGAPVRAWMALVPYAGVMLVAPLLRGAHQRDGFWAHAAVVGGAVVVAAAVSARIGWGRPRAAGPAQGPVAGGHGTWTPGRRPAVGDRRPPRHPTLC
jgi:exosortase K